MMHSDTMTVFINVDWIRVTVS